MRTVIKKSSTSHYKPGMAATVYKGNKKPIKVSKTVTRTNKRGTKTKTVTYSPKDYYDKQTKTVTRIKNKLARK